MARSKISASAQPGQQNEVPKPSCLAGGVQAVPHCPCPWTTVSGGVHHPNTSASLCPVTPEGQHRHRLSGTFNRREVPNSCSHLGKSPWPFICIGLYMVPNGCSIRVKEAQRAGRQQAKLGCTQAVNEPTTASWVSQAWPTLLQTSVFPLRWQPCSYFMLVWHGGYHGEHYSKEMHPFFFFF